jgi:hypothetical protein
MQMEDDQSQFDMDEPWRPWDQEIAEAAIGKIILAGITYLAAGGKTVKRQVQYWGAITAVDGKVGVTIECGGKHAGEKLCLPPDMKVFVRAAPGEYRLRSTGEVVVDPDFSTRWTITESIKH